MRTENSYVTVAQAARRLGVKPETLYSYVSRGLLHRSTADDGRTSLFSVWEIDSLASRGRHGHGTVDVVVTSSTTEIADGGRVRYRGHDIVELAAELSFEDAAELLWGAPLSLGTSWPRCTATEEAVAASVAGLPETATYTDRLVTGVIACATREPSRSAVDEELHLDRSRRLLSSLVSAFGPLPPGCPEPAGARLAARLWPRISSLPATQERLRALDVALVLLADHDLTPSTLAARVAAAGRADPYSAVICALGSFAGSLHGRAAEPADRLVRHAIDGGAQEALGQARDELGLVPGFGSRIHSGGDPRVSLLIETILPSCAPGQQQAVTDLLGEAARVKAGEPNLELGLAVLGMAGDFRAGATAGTFALSRMAGWLAHIREEYAEAPLRYRARTVYVGPV